MKLGSQLAIVFAIIISLIVPAIYFASTTISTMIDSNEQLKFFNITLNQDQMYAVLVSALSTLVSVAVFFSLYVIPQVFVANNSFIKSQL